MNIIVGHFIINENKMQPLVIRLALEGLEEYDPPAAGDACYINNLGMAFVYNSHIRGWVALTDFV